MSYGHSKEDIGENQINEGWEHVVMVGREWGDATEKKELKEVTVVKQVEKH